MKRVEHGLHAGQRSPRGQAVTWYTGVIEPRSASTAVALRLTATLIVVCAAVGSCREVEPTQLVVVIDSDMAVPRELDAYRVTVTGPDGRVLDEQLPAAGDSALPASFGVKPRGGRANRAVTVAVTAMHAGGALFDTRAVTSFVEERRLRLDMFLARRCVASACAPQETCRQGRCVDPEIDARDLPGYDPNDPLRTFDAGVSAQDAAQDAAPDAATSCPDPCGVPPDCGCAQGSRCHVVPAPQASGCVTDCLDDLDCGPPALCTPFAEPYEPGDVGYCVEDCDVLAGTGCPADTVCSVSNYFDIGRDASVLGPICISPGDAALGETCTSFWDCAEALGCDRAGDQPYGACATPCRSDDDCAGTRCGALRTLDGELSNLVGLCSLPCDPIADDGCGPGLACMLMMGQAFGTGLDFATPGCIPTGDADLGEHCEAQVWCRPGLVCIGDTCRQACQLGAGACPPNWSCLSVNPLLDETGYGACFPP